MITRLIPCLCTLLLSSCAGTQLHHLHTQDDPAIRNKIAQARTLKIKKGETLYSKKLECLGEKFFSKASAQLFSNPDGTINYNSLKRTMTISVAPIMDKTHKVYPAQSTAISDLVINALSRIKGIAVVEIPLDSDYSQSRNRFRYDSPYPFINENIGFMSGSIHRPPVGIVFPAQMYISGALVQYDDNTEAGSKNVNVNMQYVTGKSSVSQISIGMNLRLIDAVSGTANINPKTNMPTNVFLQNDLWKISNGANFFRIISTSPWGIDYSVNTADPVHYAVNEIVERGVYDLMKPLMPLNEDEERECDNA